MTDGAMEIGLRRPEDLTEKQLVENSEAAERFKLQPGHHYVFKPTIQVPTWEYPAQMVELGEARYIGFKPSTRLHWFDLIINVNGKAGPIPCTRTVCLVICPPLELDPSPIRRIH